MAGVESESLEVIFKMMLNGSEWLLKLSGEGAKNAAIGIFSIIQQQIKANSGISSLKDFLENSPGSMEIISLPDEKKEGFVDLAKSYGLRIYPIKDTVLEDGVSDVIYRAEDSAIVRRLLDRLEVGKVDVMKAETIAPEMAAEMQVETIDENELTKEVSQNPLARSQSENPSLPSSETGTQEWNTTSKQTGKPSLLGELYRRAEARRTDEGEAILQEQADKIKTQAQDKSDDSALAKKKTPQHNHPEGGKKKSKDKKMSEPR
jgi:hypothetical protein